MVYESCYQVKWALIYLKSLVKARSNILKHFNIFNIIAPRKLSPVLLKKRDNNKGINNHLGNVMLSH